MKNILIDKHGGLKANEEDTLKKSVSINVTCIIKISENFQHYIKLFGSFFDKKLFEGFFSIEIN